MVGYLFHLGEGLPQATLFGYNLLQTRQHQHHTPAETPSLGIPEHLDRG